jgi:hypothetical protein
VKKSELKEIIKEEILNVLNENKDPKLIHLQTRKTRSIKDPAYPFYVIKDYLETGYWDKITENEFKKAFNIVIPFLLTPGSNTERLAKEYNWMVDYDSLWQFQKNKED